MLQMLAIFAELERSFIQERTMAGLAAARAFEQEAKRRLQDA